MRLNEVTSWVNNCVNLLNTYIVNLPIYVSNSCSHVKCMIYYLGLSIFLTRTPPKWVGQGFPISSERVEEKIKFLVFKFGDKDEDCNVYPHLAPIPCSLLRYLEFFSLKKKKRINEKKILVENLTPQFFLWRIPTLILAKFGEWFGSGDTPFSSLRYLDESRWHT